MSSRTSTTNTAASDMHANGDPNISLPLNHTAAATAWSHASNQSSTIPSTQRSSSLTIDPSFAHNGYRSLSSIALQAFTLGLALSLSTILTLYLVHTASPLWRLPQFIATLSIFHFLEFYTTARWNAASAKVSSFLLFSNGRAYNIAHSCAMLEILLSCLVWPGLQARISSSWTLGLGLLLVVLGQGVRSAAMATAGTNFNHVPVKERREGHVLVTQGIYGVLRHPAYFGFFWWAVGTQLVVGNAVCFVAYTIVLWKFFHHRIVEEEKLLCAFFEDEYVRYRSTTSTGIPFIR